MIHLQIYIIEIIHGVPTTPLTRAKAVVVQIGILQFLNFKTFLSNGYRRHHETTK